MSDEGVSDADVFNALEGLGAALFVLSGRLKSARFLDDDVNHSFYEHVIARHAKADRYTRDYMVTTAARATAAERERDALREALQCIADGGEPRPLGKSWFPDLRTSKHDQCTHSVWMYEDCGNCTSGYARASLTANHSAPVVD